MKDEPKWHEEVKCNLGTNAQTAKHTHQMQHPEITEMMDLWVAKAMEDHILLTGKVLHQKWTWFMDLAGIPPEDCLALSDGWLACLKAQYCIKQYKWYGQAGSIDQESVERERAHMREVITTSGYDLHDIFNMDETALLYAYILSPFHKSYHTHTRNRMPPN